MRGAAVVLTLVMVLLGQPARAEDVARTLVNRLDLSPLREFCGAEDPGSLILRLASGELTDGREALAELPKRVLNRLRRAMGTGWAALASPALLCAALTAFAGSRGRAARGVRLICCAATASMLTARFLGAKELAEALLERMSKLAGALSPALVSVAALTGASGAATFTPAASLCASLVEGWLAGPGIALTSSAAAVAAMGSLSESVRLDGFYRLLKGATLWIGGLVSAAYMGLMSVEGLLGAGRGGLTARTARFALESLVPLIGGEVSEAMDALAASVSAIRGAMGAAGLALAARQALGPVVGIAANALGCRLAGALAEAAGEQRMARLLYRFGEAMDMLAALCLASALLVVMMTGGFLAFTTGLGRGIGLR